VPVLKFVLQESCFEMYDGSVNTAGVLWHDLAYCTRLWLQLAK